MGLVDYRRKGPWESAEGLRMSTLEWSRLSPGPALVPLVQDFTL